METGVRDISEIFEIKTANEWIREAKKKPVPKRLFGDFWLEGELAILFADTGKGKSLLAVQIAEAIARGRNVFSSPVGEMTARPQKVLYLDFELSQKQFEMRYAAEHDPEKGEFLKNHYQFSDKFKRVEVRPEAMREQDRRSFEALLRHGIEPLVRKTGAKVLIIDNITYLKRTAESSRESAPLMKELKRLKNELGLSILVIAHTPKRDTRRPIVVNDMQGSKVIANFADNIFAIGQSTLDASERYVKHIKPRSTELVYGARHVPVFRVGKIGGNFLGFEFRRFAPEADLLRNVCDKHEWETIDKMKRASDGGMSIREIAAEFGMSKSTVHRMLHMWREGSGQWPVDGDQVGSGQWSVDGGQADSGQWSVDGGQSAATGTDGWEPPKEAYRGEHTDQYLISRGMRPVWKEKVEAERGQSVSPEAAGGDLSMPSVLGISETTEDTEQAGDPKSKIQNLKSSMKRSLDGYGREIFIESEDANGKPMVWYQYNSNGDKFRQERKGWAVVSERIGKLPPP